MSNIDFYHKYAPDVLRDPFYFVIEKYKLWIFVYLAQAVILTTAGFLLGWWWTGQYAGGIQLGASWCPMGRGAENSVFVACDLCRQLNHPHVGLS